MTTAASTDMDALKSKLKTVWEAGDFSEVAKHIETVAEDFVNRLDIKPGMKVIDVACGSGNLAVIAAQKGATVTGIDIADNLVEAAKQRADKLGLDIKFEQGDAEAMPYADDSFDVVMTMFGAMFAPRPEVTASELVRVCRPGGTIAMANWTPTGFAGQMFKLGGKYVPPPPMPAPVLWGVPDEVKARFGDKIENLRTTPQFAEFSFEYGPDGVAEHFKTYFGPTVMALKAMGEENHEAFTKDLVELWAQNNTRTDGTTLVKGEYLEVIANKK
jgi:ubiquinone/menaquinone biosynthesis C-methylase UbiE